MTEINHVIAAARTRAADLIAAGDPDEAVCVLDNAISVVEPHCVPHGYESINMALRKLQSARDRLPLNPVAATCDLLGHDTVDFRCARCTQRFDGPQ